MICPAGFFCFDRYTFSLVILGLGVLYYTMKPKPQIAQREQPIHIINQQPELSYLITTRKFDYFLRNRKDVWYKTNQTYKPMTHRAQSCS